eukprot:TRINITY_DN15302_c0_g1::TRINITY_DN15302_c0_g1_i1::g.30871::m.30871 TRINITY_DN15302_c0_g1::TRINITY_DN15302_c0_g1_i1::g.30871  ORF type:complete len:156 (+),score=2.57,YdjO/PF14169.1/0.2 TRINITY_DN15302_c0_g1_i1:11-478(+)
MTSHTNQQLGFYRECYSRENSVNDIPKQQRFLYRCQKESCHTGITDLPDFFLKTQIPPLENRPERPPQNKSTPNLMQQRPSPFALNHRPPAPVFPPTSTQSRGPVRPHDVETFRSAVRILREESPRGVTPRQIYGLRQALRVYRSHEMDKAATIR